MTPDSQDLKALLLETDDEYRQLVTKHQELDRRLQELSTKSYLSQPEQIEASNLKKRKLQLKDRMEEIIRRRRDHLGSQAETEPQTSLDRH